jgi:hypothetical protein
MIPQTGEGGHSSPLTRLKSEWLVSIVHIVNILDHPVFELLPSRTQTKLRSAVSEDKLSWDCFYEAFRADVLSRVLACTLNISIEDELSPKLVMWGYLVDEDSTAGFLQTPIETRPKTAVKWEPLSSILAEIENYNDGKPEGQKTEPDVIVVGSRSLVLFECKRNHGLGRCSRFEDERCPEIHTEKRKRDYCQYWDRGLPALVNFVRPTPATTSEPDCHRFYQLMRNHMIGTRLATKLGCAFHPVVVKNQDSPCFVETEREVRSFNERIPAETRYKLVSWAAVRDKAREFGVEVLSSYRL